MIDLPGMTSGPGISSEGILLVINSIMLVDIKLIDFLLLFRQVLVKTIFQKIFSCNLCYQIH